MSLLLQCIPLGLLAVLLGLMLRNRAQKAWPWFFAYVVFGVMNLGARALRAEQRRRIYILRGLVKRMIHNSVVLSDFDIAILGDCKCRDERDSKLRQAIIKVHIYCQATRVRLGVRLLLPYAFGLIATPGLSRLRKVASVDGPRAYEELRTAALEAFAQLRPDELEALNRGL
jgi:hypothetical protein